MKESILVILVLCIALVGCASVADATHATATTAANTTTSATTVPAAQVTAVVTTAVATSPQPTPTKAGTLPVIAFAAIGIIGLFAIESPKVIIIPFLFLCLFPIGTYSEMLLAGEPYVQQRRR